MVIWRPMCVFFSASSARWMARRKSSFSDDSDVSAPRKALAMASLREGGTRAMSRGRILSNDAGTSRVANHAPSGMDRPEA